MFGPFRTKFEPCDVLVGAINGSNVIFRTTIKPRDGNIQIHLNGVVQTPGIENDYVADADGSVVRFVNPPLPGDRVTGSYLR